MNVRDESGKKTDWWFIYKMPVHVGGKENIGGDYLYYDEDSSSLKLSRFSLAKKEGALYHTLDEIFKGVSKDQGFIIYNDENPDGDRDQQWRGHCKGILCFNKKEDSGLILLHSVPRFPFKGELDLPANELKYGQTFLCIELSGYEVAEKIAYQMLHQQDPEVNVKDSYLPEGILPTEALYKLYHESDVKEIKEPSIVKFKSKKGKDFQLIAKSKVWHDDFWVDLVSPTLKVDMDVESWRRGPVTASQDDESSEDVKDVMEVDLEKLHLKGYRWKYTQDHSKWGITAQEDVKKGKWVCIADINRMISQEKRGGGGICFLEPNLWDALIQIVPILQEEN
ncbi:MAG: deoxyribonuclease II family protein [Saprospiraceae bacterium]|nr:deoxyribonuclease II family protein [Saprospiraceae bacterium]